MNVSISGSGGFVGKALSRAFNEKGWTVKPINRESLSMPDDEFMSAKIEGSDVIINLSGANISKRWNKEYQNEIRESRIKGTHKIVSAILACSGKPKLLISASGVDIYSNKGSHDESSTSYSDSFLGKVCLDWEKEASEASGVTRVVNARMGMVLGKDGGAMKKMFPPFSTGLGAKIGKGDQWMSFVHVNDLVRAFIFIIENEHLQGPVNIVSPYPVTNSEFSSTFGKVLKQPVFLTIPGSLMKLLFGEGAVVTLDSHKVLPGKLSQAGFLFNYPTITNALVNLFG